MGLEAVVICLDNSEWNRNGDFAPSRFENQKDAANIICEAKTQQNPENTVGIMSYAGKRCDVKATQTQDIGDLINAINAIEINGEQNFFTGVKIAQLSLKNRQNKRQQQRVICFVGSPLEQDESEFEQLGMRLKRNNVAIDIINFANPENVPKLTALVNAANNDNSHFVDVPLGVNQITNVLLESPIINGDQDMGAGAEVGNAGGNAGGSSTVPQQFQEYGGIDPNIDPELAMAMRISMEEERAKQQEAKPEENKPKENENQDQQQQQQQPQVSINADVSESQQQQQQPQVVNNNNAGGNVDDDEEFLRQAIALSLQEDQQNQQKADQAKADTAENKDDAKADDKDYAQIINNDFVSSIVNDLGLQIGSDEINQVVNSVSNNQGDDKKKEGEDKDKKKDEEKKD